MGRVLTWAGCGGVALRTGHLAAGSGSWTPALHRAPLICDVFQSFLQYVFELLRFVMSLQLSEASGTDVGQSAASELRISPCGWHANSGRLLRISPIQFLSYRSDHFRLGRCWVAAAHHSSVSSFLRGKRTMWLFTKRAARRMQLCVTPKTLWFPFFLDGGTVVVILLCDCSSSFRAASMDVTGGLSIYLPLHPPISIPLQPALLHFALLLAHEPNRGRSPTQSVCSKRAAVALSAWLQG